MQQGNPSQGFLYGGVFHTRLPVASQRQATKKLIDPSLRADAKKYMEDAKDLNRGIEIARHGITFLLRECGSDQDLRDLLPDTIVKFIPGLQSLPRTRRAGWVFEQRPFQKLRFEEIVNHLEYHISNRIF